MKYWWLDHKLLLVCYPLKTMKLIHKLTAPPPPPPPLSVLLIWGSRGQGHGILFIWNGIRTIKLAPCVEDIPCIDIQRPERGFVTRFCCIFDVSITCSKLNSHCGSVFKVDLFLNCISNALSTLHEFKVDSTPLHSTTPFHDSTP